MNQSLRQTVHQSLLFSNAMQEYIFYNCTLPKLFISSAAKDVSAMVNTADWFSISVQRAQLFIHSVLFGSLRTICMLSHFVLSGSHIPFNHHKLFRSVGTNCTTSCSPVIVSYVSNCSLQWCANDDKVGLDLTEFGNLLNRLMLLTRKIRECAVLLYTGIFSSFLFLVGYLCFLTNFLFG